MKMGDGSIDSFSANQMYEEMSQMISKDKEGAIDIKVSGQNDKSKCVSER